MRIGIVSDVHCNIGGLDAALAALGPIDELICLGDSIYEYRFSNEVVGRLREHDAHIIHGNHEEVFFSAAGARARSRAGIDPDLLEYLAGQPHRRLIERAGKRILLVHSTPWEPRGTYVYSHSAALGRFAEAGEEADIVLYGHTHTPLARQVGEVLVVNPGSAGEGRDHRNARTLSCALLDLPTGDVEFLEFPDPRVSAL